MGKFVEGIRKFHVLLKEQKMTYKNYYPISLSILIFFSILLILFISTNYLYAAPISGLFNTGINDEGAILPVGDVDPHYELIGPSSPAQIIAPHPVWVPGAPRAAWIGPSNGSQSAPPGTYTFALTFDLTGFDPTTAIIIGTWTADNTAEIFLNGISTGHTIAFRGFVSLQDFTISNNSPFAISKSQKLNFGGVFARLSDFLVNPTALSCGDG